MTQAAELYNARAQSQGWASYCDPTLSFDHDGFHQLVGLWHTLRGAAPLPPRQAMTARLLKDFLPDLALYERSEVPGGYRHLCRLMGTRVAQVYGEHTGKVMQDFLPPQHIARFCAGIDEGLKVGAPLRFLARTDSANSDYLSAEYCVMPLADAAGAPTMVMIGVSFSGVHWDAFLAQMLERLQTAQAKSFASAPRASVLNTAI